MTQTRERRRFPLYIKTSFPLKLTAKIENYLAEMLTRWPFTDKAKNEFDPSKKNWPLILAKYPYSTQAPNPTNWHELTNIWIRVWIVLSS